MKQYRASVELSYQLFDDEGLMKVASIKAMRKAFGMELKTAKNAVEQLIPSIVYLGPKRVTFDMVISAEHIAHAFNYMYNTEDEPVLITGINEVDANYIFINEKYSS